MANLPGCKRTRETIWMPLHVRQDRRTTRSEPSAGEGCTVSPQWITGECELQEIYERQPALMGAPSVKNARVQATS